MAVNYAVNFTSTTSLSILGTAHNRQTASLRVACYDTAGVLQHPSSVQVHPTTYTVTIGFVQATDGWVVINGGRMPSGIFANFGRAFTGQTTVVILGTAHGFGTKALLVDVYDDQIPAREIRAGQVTVHPTTFDVTLTFLQPQSGYAVLCAFGNTPPQANLSYSLVAATTTTITGLTLGLHTRNVGVSVWNNATPRALIEVGQVTVHPTTFDIMVTNAQPVTGFLIVNGSQHTSSMRIGGGTVAVQSSINSILVTLPPPDI